MREAEFAARVWAIRYVEPLVGNLTDSRWTTGSVNASPAMRVSPFRTARPEFEMSMFSPAVRDDSCGASGFNVRSWTPLVQSNRL